MEVRTRRGSVSRILSSAPSILITISYTGKEEQNLQSCKRLLLKKKTRSTDAADGCFRRFADFVLVWYIAWHRCSPVIVCRVFLYVDVFVGLLAQNIIMFIFVFYFIIFFVKMSIRQSAAAVSMWRCDQ